METEGTALSVVLPEEHCFKLNEEALERLLNRDDIKDRNVVIVSVAGVFRKGKSFLLDFFLRYLKRRYGQERLDESWLGDENEPLQGFNWKGGSERDTTGLLLWSEVFTTTTPSGEEIAILLMDTQGTFDSHSTVKDCATVFALSTMLSSVLVYNLSGNIQEDDLQHLQLFTEYGRLALADTGTKPFQKLMFLVRDWSYPYEFEFGAVGGAQFIEKRLKLCEKQHPELQSIRKHIRSCFTDIDCFLMPHPGLEVATNPKFDGRLSEIGFEFKLNLKKLVYHLLAPENLKVKEIGGSVIKVKDLFHYFVSYTQIYKGGDFPEPKSILVATAEANNLSTMSSCKELYTGQMDSLCGGGKPYVNPKTIDSEHKIALQISLDFFDSKKKMGGDEFSLKYREALIKDLQSLCEQYESQNASKDVFMTGRTPCVFLSFGVLLYFISGISDLLGSYLLATISTLLLYVITITIMTWCYIRVMGEMTPISEAIDITAEVLWENVLKPFYRTTLHYGYNVLPEVLLPAAPENFKL